MTRQPPPSKAKSSTAPNSPTPGEAAQSSAPAFSHAPARREKHQRSAAPPDRAQRMSNLERANEVRLARAELKRKIRSGEIFAASLLLDPPREAAGWELGGLLMAQRPR